MSAPLVFMDTETTGLSLDDDIWEFAAIRRDPDGTETELHLFIEHDRAKCARLPESFRADHDSRYRDHQAVTRRDACTRIAELFAGGRPHVVGAVPNFDTERIARMVRVQWPHWEKGINWHYHLIDVENLVVGYLAHARHRVNEYGEVPPLPLPWDSNAISRMVGVNPDDFDRHTAMGDVRWAMAIYDAVMGDAR